MEEKLVVGDKKKKIDEVDFFQGVKLTVVVCCDSHPLCLLLFRYTGSYNYGSYGNQHPHPMQSQYPALPHDTAISGPLHYSPYHRSSAQVSVGAAVLPAVLCAQSSQLNTANESNVCATCRSSRAASSMPSRHFLYAS